MATDLKIKVNDQMRNVTSAPDTPLLYALTDELSLHGPRFVGSRPLTATAAPSIV